MIVQQRNLYTIFKDIHISKAMSVSDFWLFLGVIIYMACIDLPGIEYYWKQSTRQQPVADAITRNRFREILKTLHFNDASIEPGRDSELYDKIYKVRPLLDAANFSFGNVVRAEGVQSIDEQMVLFTGKTAPAGLHQYMPMKPISHGFKLWARCGVSGYTYEVELFTGRSKKPQTSTPLDISFEPLNFDRSSISSASNSIIGETSSTRLKRNVRSVYATLIASASATF